VSEGLSKEKFIFLYRVNKIQRGEASWYKGKVMTIKEIENIALNAKKTSLALARSGTDARNNALAVIAKNIEANEDAVYRANALDLENSRSLVESGEISKATYGRLKLDENKMRDMIQGIYDVIKLDDPINEVFWRKKLDDDLILEKISCPIGVIGVIFEARPDVIAQISALAVKSGNAVLLKGGRESAETNKIIGKIVRESLCSVKDEFENAVNLLESREDVVEMLKLDNYINLIIPRGSNELVKYIQNNTKIPVLGHASGICHIYVHSDADLEMAKEICIDAKTQYPSACNAVETILINKDFPYISELLHALSFAGIEIIDNPEDWSTEYGDVKVSVRIVSSLLDAAGHINHYGSGHTDAIITQDPKEAEIFMHYVDSAGVFHNVSTRFSDGFRYGFGAEVGISTNKTHARGPVGLDGLTTYKYKLRGIGQIARDYCDGTKTFKHEVLPKDLA